MYRVWQFARALTARVQNEEWALVERLLFPCQMALFRSMSRQEQRHGLDLGLELERQGHHDLGLLQAALLHDVGKVGHVGLWHRVAAVVLVRFAPGILYRLVDRRPGGWGYPFFIYMNHSRLGAEKARKAGCSALTVELIRRHHEYPLRISETRADKLLVILQAADGRW